MKPDIRDLTRKELEDRLSALGHKKCHAGEVFRCLYRRGAAEFGAMARVPARARAGLERTFRISSPPVAEKIVSMTDGTRKYLFRFPGGAPADGMQGQAPAESVLLPNREGFSACLSSQSGCACGCSFCATGAMGLKRDLAPSEIAAQFALCLKEAGGKLDSVVFMGMGEPFLNWENVKRAVLIISDDCGWGFGQRRMTLSTVGVVPVIEELAASAMGVRLAISVVTADPAQRARLVPLEAKYPLREVLRAAGDYCRAKRAGVLLEYVLFPGLNDSPADAARLAALARGLRCRVNLIRHNPAAGGAPGPARAAEFQGALVAAGVRTYLRPEKGSDIRAACGQLAAK